MESKKHCKDEKIGGGQAFSSFERFSGHFAKWNFFFALLIAMRYSHKYASILYVCAYIYCKHLVYSYRQIERQSRKSERDDDEVAIASSVFVSYFLDFLLLLLLFYFWRASDEIMVLWLLLPLFRLLCKPNEQIVRHKTK